MKFINELVGGSNIQQAFKVKGELVSTWKVGGEQNFNSTSGIATDSLWSKQ